MRAPTPFFDGAGFLGAAAAVVACSGKPPVPDTGSVSVDASVVLEAQPAYICPGISGFSISPAAVLGSQLAELSIRTMDGPSAIRWTATPCSGTGTIMGFIGPDGGPDTSGLSVSFNCGSCSGTTTVTAQVENFQVPVTGGPSVNVCYGVPFTSISGNIDCEQ